MRADDLAQDVVDLRQFRIKAICPPRVRLKSGAGNRQTKRRPRRAEIFALPNGGQCRRFALSPHRPVAPSPFRPLRPFAYSPISTTGIASQTSRQPGKFHEFGNPAHWSGFTGWILQFLPSRKTQLPSIFSSNANPSRCGRRRVKR